MMYQQTPKKCVVVTCFSENQPGYLDFSYRIHSLAKHYHVTILSQDQLTHPELLVQGADYVSMGRKSGKYGWLNYLLKCAFYIRKCNPVVVVLLHSSASPITLMIKGIPACLYWNEHPTNLIHLPDGFSPIRKTITRILHQLVFFGARFADVVMPIGEEHEADLLAHGCDRKKVRLIYMGVADEFSMCNVERSSPLNTLELIYIGTVSAPRGRDVMLNGMAEAIQRGTQVHLTIVGATDDQLAYCNERLNQLRIHDHVSVMGRVPGREIPRLLTAADMGVCLWEDKPWWRFNPPTKLFEYLAAGLPVLASDIRTHTRYIENWNNGLIFQYGAQGFSDAIDKLLSNRDKISEMKVSALDSGKRYLWSRIEPEFMNCISGAIKPCV